MTEREALNWEPIRKFWRNNSGANWDELETAIKEALAQPEQEPVRREQKMFMEEQEFYATPQQRTWVGLTDEEKLVANQMWRVMDADGFIKAIEAKLKEKNT